MIEAATRAFVIDLAGGDPVDEAVWREALTHGSSGAGDYQRLEFLGDRVLGLVIASELFRRFPKAAEGELSSRLHALASGETCARIAQAIDLNAHVRERDNRVRRPVDPLVAVGCGLICGRVLRGERLAAEL